MKKLQLNILLFLTLITNICLADVPLLNNNPATIGKGNFDFLIGGTLPLLPPVDDNFDFFTPLIGNLNFGYGITDKIYMQLGSSPLIQPDPKLGLGVAVLLNTYSSLYLGIQYQWLGEPINKITEGQWSSTANLSAGLYRNILLSNSFGYMIKNWLSIYGGVQVVTTKIYHKRETDKYLFKTAEQRLFSYGLFAGIHLNKNILSDSKLIYMLEVGSLYTSFIQTEDKEKLWAPRISTSLSYSF